MHPAKYNLCDLSHPVPSNDNSPFNELIKGAILVCSVSGKIQVFIMRNSTKAFCIIRWYLWCILQLAFFNAYRIILHFSFCHMLKLQHVVLINPDTVSAFAEELHLHCKDL